jgi:hypothetical protein
MPNHIMHSSTPHPEKAEMIYNNEKQKCLWYCVLRNILWDQIVRNFAVRLQFYHLQAASLKHRANACSCFVLEQTFPLYKFNVVERRWRRCAAVIASARGTDDSGSNPARV